jgi:hypothetical protein
MSHNRKAVDKAKLKRLAKANPGRGIHYGAIVLYNPSGAYYSKVKKRYIRLSLSDRCATKFWKKQSHKAERHIPDDELPTGKSGSKYKKMKPLDNQW